MVYQIARRQQLSNLRKEMSPIVRIVDFPETVTISVKNGIVGKIAYTHSSENDQPLVMSM